MSDFLKFTPMGAEAYERQMGRWSRRLAEPFLDFAGIADGESVLDLGCGTGSLSFAICRRARLRELQGIDLSPDFVARAEALRTDQPAEFRVGDATALPYDDGAFDRVLSQLVLQFVPDWQRAVAEMRRVARPGGIVAAATWDTRGGFVANRMFFDTAAMIDAGAAERRARNFPRPLSRPGDLAAAWREAGLTEIAETMLLIRMEFDSFDDYWVPMTRGGGPIADYFQSLDAATGARIEDAVRRAFQDGEPDGPRSYAAIAWAVRGRAPG